MSQEDAATHGVLSRTDQLHQSIADLQYRIDVVISAVKLCVAVVDRINHLADLRDGKQNELNDLRNLLKNRGSRTPA